MPDRIALSDRWALEGMFTSDGCDTGDLEAFRLAAVELSRQLSELHSSLQPQPPDQRPLAEALCDAAVFMATMAQMLDPAGESDFKIVEARKRGRGRRMLADVDGLARAQRGYRAAAMVERLVRAGVKEESAVKEVGARPEINLGRSEMFTWIARRRQILAARRD